MNKLAVYLQCFIPQHLLSRLMGKLANWTSCTWLKNKAILWFIKRYIIDMGIAEISNPLQYQSFNAFFTRKLIPSARPICAEKNAIISPADGTISQLGNIEEHRIFQAKGFHYTLESLLTNAEDAEKFINGNFITIYLSPKDYHRIHMPIDGRLIKMTCVPGSLFSVNQVTSETVPNLYARNERMVAVFETSAGLISVIMVGAMIVAGIHTVWAGKVCPQSDRTIQTFHYYDEIIQFKKGDELGHFELGSTVIALSQENLIKLDPSLKPEKPLLFGEQIAAW